MSLPLVVPAYFHPATNQGDWLTLVARAEQLRCVILNIAGGPGAQVDPAFSDVVDKLLSAGVTIAGYVDTNYAKRPLVNATREFTRYRNWYGVEAVFFDQVSTGIDHLPHYAELANEARKRGAEQVIFNHGAYPDPGYANYADLLGTFEGPLSAYTEMTVPHWARSHPAERFSHLLYAVPVTLTEHITDLVRHRGAGAGLVTELSGVNPWSGLPATMVNGNREEGSCSR